jgi:hypothetical protein
MRATSLALLLTASTLLTAPLAHAHDDADHGPQDGDVQQTHDLQDFDAIDVRGVYRLNVVVGDDYKVFTSGQPKETDRMKVYVKNGVLILDQDKEKTKSKNRKGVWVDISLPSLNDIDITGVGTGDISGVDSDNFELDVSGVGELTITGRCGDLDTTMRGVGEINARGLECENADVNLKGVGEVTLFASESVDVSASGIGSVGVYGKPKKVEKSKGFLSGVTIH